MPRCRGRLCRAAERHPSMHLRVPGRATHTQRLRAGREQRGRAGARVCARCARLWVPTGVRQDVSRRQHIPACTCAEGVDERNKCLRLLACTHPAERARTASRALHALRCVSVRTRARLHTHAHSEALRLCFASEPPPLGACIRVPPGVRAVTLLHTACPSVWPWLTQASWVRRRQPASAHVQRQLLGGRARSQPAAGTPPG